MTDFIDGVEQDLVEAARREARERRSVITRLRRRAPRRGVAITIAALFVAGSATAAVVSLSARPSRPLAGPVNDAKPSARSYSIELLPSLLTGQAGWCTILRLSTSTRLTMSGMGCGPARAAGANMIAGGGVGGSGANIEYVVATSKTRAVRFGDGQLVATRSDPLLPYDWRFAVAVTAGQPQTTIPPPAVAQTTGQPESRPAADPAKPQPKTPRTSAAAAPLMSAPVLLDAHGRELASTTRADDHSRGARTRRITRAQPAAKCIIGAASGYRVSIARVALGHADIAPQLEGRAFFTCARTLFRSRGSHITLNAMILLDAVNPQHRAAALPATPGLSGRRLGTGWLAVYGGTRRQRAELMGHLQPVL